MTPIPIIYDCAGVIDEKMIAELTAENKDKRTELEDKIPNWYYYWMSEMVK